MKKSLLIIVPNLQCGGQQRVAVNTAEIFSDDYEITFVFFDGSDAVYMPPCEVIDLAIPAVPGKLLKLKNALHRAYALLKLKRDKHIDFALSFGTTANLSNVLSGQSSKTIVNFRGFDSISDGWINRFVFGHSDVIICCANAMRNRLALINPSFVKKTVCIYNPYDTERMRVQGNEPVTDYVFCDHTIVTHGRLEEVKNYPRLIKAFYLVKKALPDAQLLIIGEGSLRQKLDNLISLYDLESCVTLLGFRKTPFSYLAKSALYVLSSYSEGFPNALVEGMTFLPAVAVDCKSGPREILSDGPVDRVCQSWEEVEYGVLVQPAEKREFCDELTDDDHFLANAILSILSDPVKARNLQSKARLRAEVFSYETYRQNLIKIFEG